MECNRDEAIRAKIIAERKLTGRDFAGAKKFALKAKDLYSGLEGLSQLLTTLDVYISAENKISGEVDWYGVLGVSPLADDEAVKKQYRKLALMLHPDKNKSVGADGAFKLLSEAWSLLSDKTKRLAYNQRRSSKGFHQKVTAQNRGPAAPPRAPSSANGFRNFTTSATSNAKAQNNSARVCPTAVPPPSHRRTDTFWTICHRCKMHYEYLKIYLNHTLLCPNCHEAFLASEMAPPSSFSKSSNFASRQKHQNSSHHATNTNSFGPGRNAGAPQNSGPGGSAGVNSFNHTHVHQGPFSRMAGVGSTISSPSTAAKAANVVQQANEKVKREHEEGHTTAWREKSHVSSSVHRGESLFKKRRGLDDDGNGYGGNMANQMAMGNGRAGIGSIFGVRKGSYETHRAYVFSGINNKPYSTRELTLLEIRSMLMEKARMDIRKKLNEWSSENIAKAADKGKEKVKVSKKEKEGGAVKGDRYDRNGSSESSGTKRGDQAKKCFSSTPAHDADKGGPAPMMSIDVPDPDFHDFDLDRTESCFRENQVWAAYDGDDGMPRFYAMIHKVISSKPFKMQISWLNSKNTNEFGPVDWIGSGFSKTCGDFRVGKYEINSSLNSFSHKVKWTKGTRGAVCIFPKKGDVWALYRNWSPDWNEHTPDEVIHKYDMVEVLDDYNEDQGVSVTPLIKVTGFRTVFHLHLDPGQVRKIPKEEMFRFSHQVPNYLLTGQEAQNAPKGCQELDPAATPLELLQVITEANEVSMVENGKNVVEIVDNATKVNEEVTVENVEETKERERA
uniref:J domain-containing protein n=1 Tax=Davidia involucrata TaxID=16924 RepID=A0A5B7BNK4_DAVIN